MTPGHSIESHSVLENCNLYNFALEKHTFSYSLVQITVALGNRFVSILRTSNIMFHTVQYSAEVCISWLKSLKDKVRTKGVFCIENIVARSAVTSLACQTTTNKHCDQPRNTILVNKPWPDSKNCRDANNSPVHNLYY